MRNLIQNAVDFAESTVWIDLRQRGKRLHVTVGDDGPGFAPEVLRRIGEPFVSTRGPAERRAGTAPDGGYEGMGLGLFIARTLLARTGARLVFSNATRTARSRRAAAQRAAIAEDPATAAPTGALIEAVWDTSEIVAARSEGRRTA
jgi:two-component system sensor histidine kinase RegB